VCVCACVCVCFEHLTSRLVIQVSLDIKSPNEELKSVVYEALSKPQATSV
jgi:hypothetical protein